MFDTSFGPPTIESSIVDGAGQMAAAHCRWLLQIADLDGRGSAETAAFPNTAGWLSWRCSVHPVTATEYVKVARKLTVLPAVREEFAAGRLSYGQVRLLARVASDRTEQTLVEIARNSTMTQLSRVVGAYRSALEAEANAQVRHEHRHLVTWFDEDGYFVIRGRLTPEDGAVVDAALAAALRGISRSQGTYGARQADALVEIARLSLSPDCPEGARSAPAEVIVHLDAAALTGREAEQCHLESGVALAPATALRLSCDAAIVPMLHDRDGAPLSVGRRTRSIPPALRRALRARDHGCRFPGCGRQRFVAGHHVRHWARGGHTRIDNLVELCSFHHRLVHEGGWGVRRSGDDFEFVDRRGDPIPAHPVPAGLYEGQLETEVESEAICSQWAGDRLSLEWVLFALMQQPPPEDPP